jgi:hypothetical protein
MPSKLWLVRFAQRASPPACCRSYRSTGALPIEAAGPAPVAQQRLRQEETGGAGGGARDERRPADDRELRPVQRPLRGTAARESRMAPVRYSAATAGAPKRIAAI